MTNYKRNSDQLPQTFSGYNYLDLSDYYKNIQTPNAWRISNRLGFTPSDMKYIGPRDYNILANQSSNVGDPKSFVSDYSTNYGYPSIRSNQVLMNNNMMMNSDTSNYYTYGTEYQSTNTTI